MGLSVFLHLVYTHCKQSPDLAHRILELWIPSSEPTLYGVYDGLMPKFEVDIPKRNSVVDAFRVSDVFDVFVSFDFV